MDTELVPASVDLRERIEEALTDFVGADPHRSVGVVTLRGPTVAVLKAENERFPAASLLKVPLAMALYDLAARGDLSLDTTVDRASLGETVYASVLAAFADTKQFTLRELCSLMLITSDNPASDEILRVVDAARVNDALKQSGAENSHMAVGFGDDLVGGEGRQNVTTARDMIAVLGALYRNPRYAPIVQAMKNNVRNTRIPLRLPDTLPIAHKTGNLDGLAHNAGIIYGDHVDLAIVFLATDQDDTAMASIEMGDCTARVWSALGESLDGQRGDDPGLHRGQSSF
jgi:beta-lactamase class A